ncbi:MAG: chemotaxis protein CheW [Spirochaetota bacterium]|nr:chemotaxis protein CheW [Spirochaetota bacterium]
MAEDKEKILSSIQVVCFKIKDEEYGIEILKVQEILKLPKITTLPNSVDFIMGVFDLRGTVIPIVDLSTKFGITNHDSTKSTRAIVVNIGGKLLGLAIDSVSHVVKVDEKDIEPPPPVVKGISGRYIIGIGKVEEEFIVILDIEKIFSSEEIEKM